MKTETQKINRTPVDGDPERFLTRELNSVRDDARKHGSRFTLTLKGVLERARRGHWRCEVTGLPFTAVSGHGAGVVNFHNPTVRRKKKRLGYTPGNVVLVCKGWAEFVQKFGETPGEWLLAIELLDRARVLAARNHKGGSS